jgi:succinate-semialdehyde dehydrogenase/glutarate-semialdehyde dehydrogenase
MPLTLSPHDPLALQRPDLIVDGHHLDGRWHGTAGAPLVVTDPSTGEAIATVPDGSATEARAAADAAHRAFADWRETAPATRAQLLQRWHAAVLAHQDDLARLISLEQGKPLAEARGEVLYAASYIEWFAAQCWRGHGEVLAAPSPRHRLTAVLEPVGPVAAITPWNFPAAMLARKIAPALAAGCTVVTKPSEDTPLTAIALVRLAQEAGLPDGVLNLVLASRGRAAEVVDVWLADERVRKLTFTGSTGVGRHLAQASAATLKRLSLELGGNAPFIVFADADLDAAADGLLRAKFRNAGQTCVSPNRILVERPVYDAFLDRMADRIAALTVGPARQADRQVGPLINAAAVAKVQRHLDDARQHGARVVVGGHALAGPGHFFAPTLLADVHDGMACACDETFGPVVAISPFDGEAEAQRRANGTPYGLAAYFYSRDAARCHRVAGRLEAGMVGINETAISYAHAPFGGIKASGQGREGSELGLHDYQQVKYLCEGGL